MKKGFFLSLSITVNPNTIFIDFIPFLLLTSLQFIIDCLMTILYKRLFTINIVVAIAAAPAIMLLMALALSV